MVLERVREFIIMDPRLHIASKYTKLKGNINRFRTIRNH